MIEITMFHCTDNKYIILLSSWTRKQSLLPDAPTVCRFAVGLTCCCVCGDTPTPLVSLDLFLEAWVLLGRTFIVEYLVDDGKAFCLLNGHGPEQWHRLWTLAAQRGTLIIYYSRDTASSLSWGYEKTALQIDCRFPPVSAFAIFSSSGRMDTVHIALLLGEYTDICNSTHLYNYFSYTYYMYVRVPWLTSCQ